MEISFKSNDGVDPSKDCESGFIFIRKVYTLKAVEMLRSLWKVDRAQLSATVLIEITLIYR